MSLIWAKGTSRPDEAIQRFSAADDVQLDRVLFRFDIQASGAHVLGLEKAGVLSAAESSSLREALKSLDSAWTNGEFELDERHEDGHSAIESFLIEKLGEVGKKVHTGRSRNDQVLVASRLYLRSSLDELQDLCVTIAETTLKVAHAEMMTPMPGYTHLQRAVPSSVGLWMAAFTEAFADNAELAALTRKWVNKNPLGTAAGYGVNVPLERDLVSQELGFDALQINPIYAQNSRGKFEIQVIDTYAQAMLDVRRLMWDLSLYTTAEFDFVRLPDAYTTGSSIMPNKRNPDIVELLRAAYGVVEGARVELTQTLSLPSGYHRDLQNTKGPMIRAIERSKEALRLIPPLIGELQFQREKMAAAISPDMYATDIATELALGGMPFRDAYKEAARQIPEIQDRDPAESLKSRTSPGATANPLLDRLEARLSELKH